MPRTRGWAGRARSDDALAARRRPCPRMSRCAWSLLRRLPARAGLALRHGGGAPRARPVLSSAPASASASSGDGGASRAPDTSLFVPVPLKPGLGGAAEEDVGAELTRPLDKGECGRDRERTVRGREPFSVRPRPPSARQRWRRAAEAAARTLRAARGRSDQEGR